MNNNIIGNRILLNNRIGICLVDSSFNKIVENNTIGYNHRGVVMNGTSMSNLVYHNDFINNTIQVDENCLNTWDGGSLQEGNYWSDYEGEDLDGNGIGDTQVPHYKDRYPFIVPLGSIPVFHKETRYDLLIGGNVSVSSFSSDKNKTLSFRITGYGHVDLAIPRSMLDGSFRIFIDNDQISYKASWNEEYNMIHFECTTHVPVKVRIEAQIRLLGDVNGDGKVDIKDIATVAKQFGKTLGQT